MIPVTIPKEISNAVWANIGATAQMGSFADWQRLVQEARTLSPNADDPEGCYLDCLGLVWAIEKADLPRVLFALRVGLTACEAFRNEIDVALQKHHAGDN